VKKKQTKQTSMRCRISSHPFMEASPRDAYFGTLDRFVGATDDIGRSDHSLRRPINLQGVRSLLCKSSLMKRGRRMSSSLTCGCGRRSQISTRERVVVKIDLFLIQEMIDSSQATMITQGPGVWNFEKKTHLSPCHRI
jgi:hypothetical protein